MQLRKTPEKLEKYFFSLKNTVITFSKIFAEKVFYREN